ncbi:hypothetical protein CR513_03752, partial [Mucuna pruriens]
MCPALQETKSDQPESVGAIGGYQYGKQPYQSRPFDNQQLGKQPFQPGLSQGPYAAQRFGSELNNMNTTIQDLKTQIGQLANNLPSQTIPNPRGNASALTLRSGKELPQPTPQQLLRSTDADSELNISSQTLQQDKTVPLPFPTRTLSIRNLESDEELLKMFCKVEINIPLLDAIKKIPKYAKFLKELCA